MAASMISMNRSDSIIAKVLNLNPADSNAYDEIVNEYFGERIDTDDEGDSSNEEVTYENGDSDPRGKEYVPVIANLSENIVPLPHGPIHDKASENDEDLPETIPCSCLGSPCHLNFSREEIQHFKLQYLQMTRPELDIAILCKIACGIHLSSKTKKSRKAQQTERKSHRTDYFHHGEKICREFFKFIHSIGQDKLSALIQHYKANGVEPRTHANSKKLPHNALKYEDTRLVVDFILNYAEIHAIHLPGRTPKHWVSDVQLLPSDCTKTSVYKEYEKAAGDSGKRVVKLRTFQALWQRLVPFVRVMPPASDLCWTCQSASKRISESANNEGQRESLVDEFKKHLTTVKQERAYYQEVCEEVKRQLPPNRPLGKYPHCSFEGKHHVSFDFAQQMHYPSDPQQPGPIFFKTPRKCGLFGLNSEGLKVQMNYLIDEAHSSGKGANVVISYLHDYLENHSLGETDLHLHADNCAGQNKNNQMIMYLLWRCLTERNRSVRLSFLVAGHTKFSPDGGFGLIKRKLRKTKVDCLQDIVNVVNSSAEMNFAKLVGSESGPTLVPTFDWTAFLAEYFIKIKGIKCVHHFYMDGSGAVTVKESINSAEKIHSITVKRPNVTDMPPVIEPAGLSLQRQWYLFKEIRPFVSADKQDIVTQQPTVPLLQSTPGANSGDSENEEPVSAKKPRINGTSKGSERCQSGGLGRGRGRGRGRARAGAGITGDPQ